ncbi:MAG: Ldh family oxidoreductase [Chloroflexota bacterium]
MLDDYRRYSAEQLLGFITAVLVRLGVPESDARVGAWTLVHADLLGVDSHGIAHFAESRGYCLGLREGVINPRAQPRVVHETPSTALFDGDGGLGVIVATKAMELAIAKARQVGSGFVAVTNSRHFGMSAHYTLMAVEQDMIGLAMTNTVPNVAPAGGIEGRLGTNPIAVAAPAGEEAPFSMDMATSAVAAGKLRLARIRGQNIPEGWAIDAAGNPTSDAHILQKGGVLLPLGSTPALSYHKGYGLGLMVDIFSGVLTGSGYCGMIDWQQWNMGHFLGAWRIDAFRPATEFKAMMDQMIRSLRQTKTAPDVDAVLVPGEREFAAEKERRENGIPLHRGVVAPLVKLGAELGVPFPA